jgi:hypothetical protein
MCIHSHFKIKSSSQAVRNIIPSNNVLGVKRLSYSWLLESTLFMLNLSTFLVASVWQIEHQDI